MFFVFVFGLKTPFLFGPLEPTLISHEPAEAAVFNVHAFRAVHSSALDLSSPFHGITTVLSTKHLFGHDGP